MQTFKEIYNAWRASFEKGIAIHTHIDYVVEGLTHLPGALLGDHEEKFIMDRKFATAVSLHDNVSELDRIYLRRGFFVRSAYLFGEPIGVIYHTINEDVKKLAKRLKNLI